MPDKLIPITVTDSKTALDTALSAKIADKAVRDFCCGLSASCAETVTVDGKQQTVKIAACTFGDKVINRRLFMNVLKLIDGHKTQITSIVTLLVGFGVAHGWIPREYADLTLSVIGILLSGAIVHHEVKAGK